MIRQLISEYSNIMNKASVWFLNQNQDKSEKLLYFLNAKQVKFLLLKLLWTDFTTVKSVQISNFAESLRLRARCVDERCHISRLLALVYKSNKLDVGGVLKFICIQKNLRIWKSRFWKVLFSISFKKSLFKYGTYLTKFFDILVKNIFRKL